MVCGAAGAGVLLGVGELPLPLDFAAMLVSDDLHTGLYPSIPKHPDV